MSDLSDLEGIFPNSIRWNAETGILSFATFDPEAGERELVEIELGPAATFVWDMLTRERGYGKIAKGFYDFRLSPVGSPPPPFPGDDYKPATGCWLWNPELGEVRFESCAALLVRAIDKLWDRVGHSEKVGAGEQPVIRFVDRRPTLVQSIGKTYLVPVMEIVGSIPRDKVPGWATREPTVQPAAPVPLLGGDVGPTPTPTPTPKSSPTAAQRTALRQNLKRKSPKNPPTKSVAEDIDDDIPENLK